MNAGPISRGRPLMILFLLFSSWCSARIVNHWPEAIAVTPTAIPGAPSAVPGAFSPMAQQATHRPKAENFSAAAPVSSKSQGIRIGALPTGIAPALPDHHSGHREAIAVANAAWLDTLGYSRGPSGNSHPLRTVLGGALPQMIESEISRELPSSPHRWALSGWAFLRQNSNSIPVGQARYGGSQAGLIARFLVAPDSAHAPTLFARATYALDDTQDRDLAFGASVRPVPDIPVRIAAERRIALGKGGRDRTVISAITELPPARLPAGITAEIYAQAGIAGLSRSREFFDLAAVGQKKVAQIGPQAEVHVGAGVWAAGQESDYRIDAGPRTSVRFPVGEGNAKIAIDYRAKIAGNVEPTSGFALTLAQDF